MNQLILGDNLELLKKLESKTIDLTYLDPPFFSNRNYEVIWGDEGEVRSFQDSWSGGIDHYISWLKERVYQMYLILKSINSNPAPTPSLSKQWITTTAWTAWRLSDLR